MAEEKPVELKIAAEDKENKINGAIDPKELEKALLKLQKERNEIEEVKEEKQPAAANEKALEGEKTIIDESVDEGEEEEYVEFEVISIDLANEEDSDDDEPEPKTKMNDAIFGNVEMCFPDYKIFQCDSRKCPKGTEQLKEELFKKEIMVDYLPLEYLNLKLDVESVWWKLKPGCGTCPTKFNCTCEKGVVDILKNLTDFFDLVVIPDNTCTTCLRTVELCRLRKLSYCQLNLDDIEENNKIILAEFLRSYEDVSILSRIVHHWSHTSREEVKHVNLLNENITLPDSEYFDLIVIGTSSAALGVCKEAANEKLSTCLIDVLDDSNESWPFRKPGILELDALKQILFEVVSVQKCIFEAKYAGIQGATVTFFDWDMFREKATRHMQAMSWQDRASFQIEGLLYLTGKPYVLDRNTVRIQHPGRSPIVIRGKNIIVALGRKLEYEKFRGFKRYCFKIERIFWSHTLGISKTLLCGDFCRALEFGGLFGRMGLDLTIMMDNLLPSMFDEDVIRRIVKYMEKHGIRFIWNSKVHLVAPVPRGANGTSSIPFVNERLMVIGKNLTNGKLKRYYFDNVIVLPRDVPFCDVGGLEELGVKSCKFEPNLKKVDANFRSHVKNIYFLGGLVHGLQNPNVNFESLGRQLVHHIKHKTSCPNLIYDMKYGMLSARPNYTFYGLSEKNAKRIHGDDEIVVYHHSPHKEQLRIYYTQPTLYMKLVCRKRQAGELIKEDVVGLHVLCKRLAASIVWGFAGALSEGITKDELERLVGVQYSFANEVISLSTLKKEEELDEVKEAFCVEDFNEEEEGIAEYNQEEEVDRVDEISSAEKPEEEQNQAENTSGENILESQETS